jgi:hypothetical protein
MHALTPARARLFAASHTAAALKEGIAGVLKRAGLASMPIIAAVADGGANIVAALRTAAQEGLVFSPERCVNHILHLAVTAWGIAVRAQPVARPPALYALIDLALKRARTACTRGSGGRAARPHGRGAHSEINEAV